MDIRTSTETPSQILPNTDQNIASLQSYISARDAEDEGRMNALELQFANLMASIESEEQRRSESAKLLTEICTKKMNDAFVQSENRLIAKFADIQAKHIQKAAKRNRSLEVERCDFYQIYMPSLIQRQQGEVGQKLEKSRETFDIEVVKSAKAERKLIASIESLQKKKMIQCSEETHRSITLIHDLEKEIHKLQRSDNQRSERLQLEHMLQLRHSRGQLNKIIEERKSQHAIIEKKISEAFVQFQRGVMHTIAGDPQK